MTNVSYSDLQAKSLGGRFRLEAKSPDNGKIPDRSGAHREESFGFQEDFRYQLIEEESGSVVWERWQGEEWSPHYLFVDDSGWSVAITHSGAAEVLVFSPEGELAVKWFVLSEPGNQYGNVDADLCWVDSHCGQTTAGMFWLGNSLAYFLKQGEQADAFVIRPSWGRRLIVHFEERRVLTDDEAAAEGWPERCKHEEIRVCHGHMDRLALNIDRIGKVLSRKKEIDYWLQQAVNKAEISAFLLALHGETSAIRHISRLEAISMSYSETSSSAFQKHVSLRTPWGRAVFQHAIKAMGGSPSNRPAFQIGRFSPVAGTSEARLAKLDRITAEFNAKTVLNTLGIPDWITDSWNPETRTRSELWCFDVYTDDQIWQSLTLTWRGYRIADLQRKEMRPADFLERPGLISSF